MKRKSFIKTTATMNNKTLLLLSVALLCVLAFVNANRFRGESPLVEFTKEKYATFVKETYGDQQVSVEISIAAFCEKYPEFNAEPLYQITCAVAAQYTGAPNNIAYKNKN